MSIFGQASATPFGANQQQQQQQQQQQPSNAFGSNNTSAFGAQPKLSSTNPFLLVPQSNLFGNLGVSNTAAQAPKPTSSIFGSTQTQQQTGGGLGGLGQQQQQQPQQSSMFGSLGQQQQKPQQNSIFGTSNQQQQQPQQSSLFGALNQPQQQQLLQQQPLHQSGSTGMFGSLGGTANQSQPQPSSLLNGPLFQNINQNPQQQQSQQQGSVISQPQTRLWQPTEELPRPRSVVTQMETAFSKWNPASPDTLFQTYVYNSVSPDQAPFYGPGPQDDEVKWEEALRKKPTPGAIPVNLKGFSQLGLRMQVQEKHLYLLQGRLHEINIGLTDLLRRHDLQISIRAAECRRKHLQLNHQCLSLAAKVQVLKNRGYAMDSAEEELREKMLKLERNVFDPALNGRGEEIWARMVSVRERGRQLQRESERVENTLGQNLGQNQKQEIDEVVLQRTKKILEDYNSQLSHLAKELVQIQKDFEEWERPTSAFTGIRK